MKIDKRPKRGMWASGDYHGHCCDCGEEFIGDKRAQQCADCAYGTQEGIYKLATTRQEADVELAEHTGLLPPASQLMCDRRDLLWLVENIEASVIAGTRAGMDPYDCLLRIRRLIDGAA